MREFGEDVLRSDGSLDRERLGELVFADGSLRMKLNAIVPPRVGERMRELEQAAGGAAIVVHDVPLLAENHLAGNFDLVVVVDVPVRVQAERLMRERGLSRSQAEARMQAQASREERLAIATIVVDTSGSLAELDRWSAAAKIIKDQPEQAAAYRKALPRAWPVSVRGQQFEVPTDWLAKDLDSIHTKPATAAPVCGEIQQELDQMRSAAEAFEQEAGPNPVQARTRLTAVLKRAEIREVHKRGGLDESRGRMSVWFANLDETLCGGLDSHAEIGRVRTWGRLIRLETHFLGLLAQRL